MHPIPLRPLGGGASYCGSTHTAASSGPPTIPIPSARVPAAVPPYVHAAFPPQPIPPQPNPPLLPLPMPVLPSPRATPSPPPRLSPRGNRRSPLGKGKARARERLKSEEVLGRLSRGGSRPRKNTNKCTSVDLQPDLGEGSSRSMLPVFARDRSESRGARRAERWASSDGGEPAVERQERVDRGIRLRALYEHTFTLGPNGKPSLERIRNQGIGLVTSLFMQSTWPRRQMFQARM
ncbi:hypothetical protein JB92DRAFT_3148978 [Gautieria morchelliformis]|nr:hypothetical protein JB92DRAFT_3148978 [Gautieria morchelliformis]